MSMAPTVPALLAAIDTAVKLAMNPQHPTRVKTTHAKRVFWRDPKKFLSLFRRTPDDQPAQFVNGWLFYRESTRVIEAEERWRFYSIHKIKLEGYLAVADDSSMDQAGFDAQIEAIRDALRLNVSVFGNAERVVPDTVVLESSAPVTIGEIGAWHAVLELEAESIEVKSL